jgi:cephalosporin hydroxylase
MITIDTESGVVAHTEGGVETRFPMASAEAFALVSRAWLRCGWDTKYVYGFTWMGRPIIQLPEDLLRLQEVIYSIRPDVIVETGVAHGGSLVFYASLCKAMGKGRVIGVDIEIRAHNRKAIESHELFHLITLLEGSSIAPDVVSKVKSLIGPSDTVLVLLDSNHTKAHVLEELRNYGPLVSQGSFIVACDGIMGDLVGAPRSELDWATNNPRAAANAFVSENHDFALEEPAPRFNEGMITERVTYWPNGYIRRVR